jgi:tetratricopeptide (TPR) repeat protein
MDRSLEIEAQAAWYMLDNKQTVLSDQGKYEETEEMHRQALWLKETVLDKKHPSTLGSISNLAIVLRDQGKYEEAEEMHRQMRETVLGKEHPDILASI